MSNVSEFVQVPYYSDLDRYCRQINTERLERERQTLDFSPHYKRPPKIWQPDDDRLLALFGSIDPLYAAMTYEFLRKMTVGSWKDEPIRLSVNSYGGHVPSGIAMYEAIRRGGAERGSRLRHGVRLRQQCCEPGRAGRERGVPVREKELVDADSLAEVDRERATQRRRAQAGAPVSQADVRDLRTADWKICRPIDARHPS